MDHAALAFDHCSHTSLAPANSNSVKKPNTWLSTALGTVRICILRCFFIPTQNYNKEKKHAINCNKSRFFVLFSKGQLVRSEENIITKNKIDALPVCKTIRTVHFLFLFLCREIFFNPEGTALNIGLGLCVESEKRPSFV